MIFKGYFSWSSWFRFALVLAVFLYFNSMGVKYTSIFIVIPMLYLLRIITNIRAKLIITEDKVKINQFDNRHEFSISSIRKIERFENSWFKRNVLGMAPVGLTIYYNRVSDAIFSSLKADELESELKNRFKKLQKSQV